MQCMYLLNRPALPVQQVPYICNSYYDGKEWFSYPARAGKSKMNEDPNDNYPVPYQFAERTHPTNTSEQEDFFQTWLFFGLISEALGGNTSEAETTTVESNVSAGVETAPNLIIRSIYEEFVVLKGPKAYITTATFMSKVQESWTLSPTNDQENIIKRCKRLRLCLNYAWKFCHLVQHDFDSGILYSICAIGELLAYTVNAAALMHGLSEKCLTNWTAPLYNPTSWHSRSTGSAREAMLRSGWCPSDVSRCVDKFGSLQLLHFLSLLDRSKPCKSHSQNVNYMCL